MEQSKIIDTLEAYQTAPGSQLLEKPNGAVQFSGAAVTQLRRNEE